MHWKIDDEGTLTWRQYRLTPLWEHAIDDYLWTLAHGQGNEWEHLGTYGTRHTEEAKAAALRHAGQFVEED